MNRISIVLTEQLAIGTPLKLVGTVVGAEEIPDSAVPQYRIEIAVATEDGREKGSFDALDYFDSKGECRGVEVSI